MSRFDRQCLAALKLSQKIIGDTPFQMSGIPGTFSGIFSELSQEREFSEEGTGRKITYTAAIVAEITQFKTAPSLGAKITLVNHSRARKFRVVRLQSDEISHTLTLGNINQ